MRDYKNSPVDLETEIERTHRLLDQAKIGGSDMMLDQRLWLLLTTWNPPKASEVMHVSRYLSVPLAAMNFNRNQLNIGDKIWYEAGFPDIQAGTIKDKRVLYNNDNSCYVEYKLTFWTARGLYGFGSWMSARWVVGIRM